MFDLLIKGATIVDGTGAKAWVGDAAIVGDRFAALDHHIPGEARRVIAADGYMLAPGFIDIHCHSDFSLFDHPGADIKLRQGVTLEVLGNCGTSLAPLEAISRTLIPAESDSDIQSWEHPLDWTSYGQYAHTLEAAGLSINVTGLVGHGTLRLTAMGPSDKTPTPDQMDCMKSLLSQSMDEGAAGLSTGLIYAPGCFADTRELVELAGVTGSKGGYYASHIRNDGSPNQGRPHPRLYGTFPRVIRRVVRELGALSMEAAVHKMSGLTARRLGLKDSGTLRKGFKADAVLFDPLTFGDTATYDHPRSFPRGLLATIVNGEVVINREKHTGAKPGVFYRR